MRVRSVVVAAALLLSAVTPATNAAGTTPVLARYPYLTDLTSSSVAVTWATTSLDSSPGVVTFGAVGSNCTDSIASATKAPSTYTAFGETTPYYQHSVQLTNLVPSTAYCYRVYSGTTTPGTPLLGEPQQFPTTFTTLPPVGSAASFSFNVLGDWGETSLTNNSPLGTYNGYQDALESQLAASARLASNPATFAVSTGDIAYSGGTPSNYGDLNHPGDGLGGAAEQSNVFDARYWAKVGGSLPLFATTGNHGRNNTFFSTWPTPTNVQASAGAYGTTVPYPSVDGLPAGNYPSDWYAFTVANVRFYILDADWTDLSQASSPTLGTACRNGTCPTYQADRDEHWQQTSSEYQWLSHDLQGDVSARGASALRMAFFHYPLRVDQNNYTTQQDVYLQNSAANPTGAASSLEALLSASHVNLAFNGHAHLYQRNVPPAGRAEAADIVSIYVGKSSALERAVESARLAGELGMDVVIGSNGEMDIGAAAQLHVACACERIAAIPHGIIGHHFYEEDATLVTPLDIDGLVARLPDGPGLGVEPSEEVRRSFSS